MAEKKQGTASKKLKLTDNIISGLDLGRTIRELEKIDDFLHQEELRETTPADVKTTETLKGLIDANQVTLSDTRQRKWLLDSLGEIKLGGKKVHISFAVEPSPDVLQKITVWMRQNIEEYLIVNVGIQPTISVGCVVRTENKVFDMSLRNRFSNSKQLLMGLAESRK